jgi:hypothetical protein
MLPTRAVASNARNSAAEEEGIDTLYTLIGAHDGLINAGVTGADHSGVSW